MTLDFSSLAPLPTPTQIPETAVVVGEKTPVETPAMLSAFEKTLKNPSEATALVVTTSGSTGMPKQTALSSRAITASAHATEQFVGAQNAQWLLALPTHYVAGSQVIARSVIAGTKPVIARNISEGASFTAQVFLDAAIQLTARHTMVSFVPAQLHTLIEAADKTQSSEILESLRNFDGILLGGAPSSKALIARAQAENLNILRTYGSAETAGGCVYEGKPLDGVRVEIDQDSRIWLGGPTLASGYINNVERTAEHFFADQEGNTWYKTDDIGAFKQNKLRVEGRSDDILISGGVKLSPTAIVEALEEHPAVREAFVTGVPDDRWGQAVCAAVSLKAQVDAEDLKTLVKEKLGRAAAPKYFELLDAFPTLSTGKPDRKHLAQLLETGYRRPRQ